MTRAFISYSHADDALRAEFNKHLSLLRRQGLIDLWSDQRIPAGGEFDKHISAELEAADVVILLISPNFMASDYCYGIEMAPTTSAKSWNRLSAPDGRLTFSRKMSEWCEPCGPHRRMGANG
jgi:hypothetical protein